MSWAIWITGVPGSGKSAIARATASNLAARDEPAQVLDLDEIHAALTPSPTGDAAEREAVHRALVMIARTLTSAGVPVIIAATAHRRAWRDLARETIPDFAEVQLVCPREVARTRASVPDVDVPYEPAIAPELTIDTTRETVDDGAVRVTALARKIARPTNPASYDDGWAVWISGRPGSGKTTVVAAVRERLHRRGVWATVLEPSQIAAAIATAGLVTARECEIAARASVQAAKLLSDAGVAVIIDAAASFAHVEAIARELIGDFGQVELECPPELGRTRERAARWKLGPTPSRSCVAAVPDLGLAYEPARRPDLVLYTDLIDEKTAADEVLRLVDRLQRVARERRRSCASTI
jgi:adenylylsulfate kinase